jgi:hypothetical protein
MGRRTAQRPRVLVVEADEASRAAFCEHLGTLLGTGAVATPEEACRWLEGRAPGVTLLGQAEGDELMCAALARIRELHPHEEVVLVVDAPTVALCRLAMQGGAFDVLERASCLAATLDETLARAGERIASTALARRTTDRAREAIGRHEREAAAQLIEDHAVSAAWSRLDADLRREWIAAYLDAATGDAAERAAYVRETAADLAGLEAPSAVAMALHVQALGAVDASPGGQAPPTCRNLLVELLAALAEQPCGSAPAGGGDTRWHRWRLEGVEHWWLLLDGRLRAAVRAAPSGVDGHWLPEAAGTQVRSSPLPALPEALREIERRVGCGCVLDVAPAEDI